VEDEVDEVLEISEVGAESEGAQDEQAEVDDVSVDGKGVGETRGEGAFHQVGAYVAEEADLVENAVES